MKINDVRLFQVAGHCNGSDYPAGDRQVMAMDLYPEFRGQSWVRRSGERQSIQANYVEITTDSNISGIYGPIDSDQVSLIQRWLIPFLVGRDPLATELLHDQMLRMNRHGRSGLFMTAVSAADLALWDLKGKAWELPVYRLLGGPTRPAVPVYASMLGFSIEPTKAGQVAEEMKKKGFEAQKWFFRYGPGDGESGKAKNLAMANAVREAVGPHYRLMFDAFMGWDVTYAVDLAKRLAPLNPFWLEEPIPPERVAGLRKIRQTGVPVATGEHVYTRWQVKELLANEALDFVQTDPDWTGGITELVKICTLGSAFEMPVIAHGASLLPALHVAGSQSPATVPYVEFLLQHQERSQYFHQHIYRPEEGAVRLPMLPGLGIVLDEDKIEARTPLNSP